MTDENKNPDKLPEAPPVKAVAKKTPVFESKKPHGLVRDRALARAAFHQGKALFDRAGEYVGEAAAEFIAPVVPEPVIKTRDIKTRTIGKQSVTRTIEDGARTATRRIGALKNKGVDAQLRGVARENAQARTAESLAS